MYVKSEYIHLVRDLIDNYWNDFLNLKLRSVDYIYLAYGKMHILKLLILKLSLFRILVHVIFFLLGSKSSLKYIKELKLKS